MSNAKFIEELKHIAYKFGIDTQHNYFIVESCFSDKVVFNIVTIIYRGEIIRITNSRGSTGSENKNNFALSEPINVDILPELIKVETVGVHDLHNSVKFINITKLLRYEHVLALFGAKPQQALFSVRCIDKDHIELWTSYDNFTTKRQQRDHFYDNYLKVRVPISSLSREDKKNIEAYKKNSMIMAKQKEIGNLNAKMKVAQQELRRLSK
jgi:hypothetical protein